MKLFLFFFKGVTAHEMCKYFWDPKVRMDWETTLDNSKMIEAFTDDTIIFHQVHKRIWPFHQRDTCFWSHIRSFNLDSDNNSKSEDEFDDWIVVNYSTNHEQAPVNYNNFISNIF